jgi:hypothetical protein
MRTAFNDFPSPLYRFAEPLHSEQWMEQGVVPLGNADGYLKVELLDAQKDDERKRVYQPDMKRITMYAMGKGEAAHPLLDVSNLAMTYQLPGYYLLCLAAGRTPEMESRFAGYRCIEIRDTVTFFNRLDAAMALQLPDYGFSTGNVTYVSKSSFPKRPTFLDLIYTKFDHNSYQMEYRIALFLENDVAPVERHLLKLGPLSDICSMV